jgi:ATP-dependent Clp protease protease subunit
MKGKYFSLEKTNQTATINIYGDITSWAWEELGEVSAVNLSKQLEALGDVNEIQVFINSYGGEVAEGLAIYNALRRHKAKITTYCDGFACSIASVIFMAGDERVMNEASLLMIHNAWTWASGNAAELRKQADDLEKITQASVEAYKAHSSLKEDEIKALMDAETWILPEEALEYGFATSISKSENGKASQNAFKQLFDIIKAHQAEEVDDEEKDGENTDEEPKTDNESPDDSETTDDDGKDNENPEEPETDSDDSEGKPDDNDQEDEQENTTQKWSGFFNAIMKM